MGLQKILLQQHVGTLCQAVVNVGDKVKKGSLIAKPTGLGANIFSSVYGEVKEITKDAIIIKKDEHMITIVIIINDSFFLFIMIPPDIYVIFNLICKL